MIVIDYRSPYSGKRRAGCTKYPWRSLDVGQCFDVVNGSAVNLSNQAAAAGRRYGRRYRIRSGYPGGAVRITRIA